MMTRISPATAANINGAVIPARSSENDTGNNPHNPMYGIANAGGADGSLLTLIGSENSDSGGNSMAPQNDDRSNQSAAHQGRPAPPTLQAWWTWATSRPCSTQEDAVTVMESIYRISDQKMQNSITPTTANGNIVTILKRTSFATWSKCGYLKSADLADRFGNPADPGSRC